MTFHRTIQLTSLTIFLLLLFAATSFTWLSLPFDLFLRLDPAMVTVTALSARILGLTFVPAAIVILISPLLGRVFCGYICPMGTTLDGGDKLFGDPKSRGLDIEKLRGMKTLVLIFILAAALLGVSLIFLTSPLSLITRFYGLLVQPVLALFADTALRLIRPIAEWFDVRSLAFSQIHTPRFATQLFILAFFTALFFLTRVSPRFWCRYICPSGALLAILSRRPLIRRVVSQDCSDCGKCAKACPMNAIPTDNPGLTSHGECIVCQTCKNICPESAIAFRRPGGVVRPMAIHPDISTVASPSRRQFMTAGLTGVATAALNLTGLHSLYGKPGPGQVAPTGLIRPPGALPEMDFLARCVRCGECMAACPTNTLQPIWFQADFMGLFSPSLTPKRGFCIPECHQCGLVCPTEAIPYLLGDERIWAKTGTAVIFRQKCLAWEYQKSCMVCDEVCPFDAVHFEKESGNPVPVPYVVETKCSGCGYCEYYCPVQNQAAIVVTPQGAIRLLKGSYVEEGKRQGLQISIKAELEYGLPQQGKNSPTGPAPGFTE